MKQTERNNPRYAEDVVSARLGQGLVVFEPAHRRLHALNASAAMVWNRLDGTNTVFEVAQFLAPKFAGDDDAILDDVSSVVDRFGKLGLLANRDSNAVSPDGDPNQESSEPRPVDHKAAVNTAQLDQLSWAYTLGPVHVSNRPMIVRSQEREAAQAVVDLFVDVVEPECMVDEPAYKIDQPEDPSVRYLSIRHRVHDGEEQWRVYFDGVALGTSTSVQLVAHSVAQHVASLTRPELAAADSRLAPSELLIDGSAVQAGSGCVIVLASSQQPESFLPALEQRGFTPMFLPPTPVGVPSAEVLVPSSNDVPSVIDDDRVSRPIVAIVVAQPAHGGATGLERLGEVDALRLLLDRAHRLELFGADGFLTLVQVAAQSPVYRLTYSSVDAAVEVVIDVSGLRTA